MQKKSRDLFRYERKFILDSYLINSIEDLKNFSIGNIYEIYDSRTINSIYLDYDNLSFAKENINGISNRRKIRIRYYGCSKYLDSPRLEIKVKFGNIGNKDLYAIDKDELYKNKFSIGFIEAVANNKSLANEIVNLLKPKLIISYQRKYFLSQCRRFRFTLDNNINFKIFDLNDIN